jgi:hypothetical protein
MRTTRSIAVSTQSASEHEAALAALARGIYARIDFGERYYHDVVAMRQVSSSRAQLRRRMQDRTNDAHAHNGHDGSAQCDSSRLHGIRELLRCNSAEP